MRSRNRKRQKQESELDACAAPDETVPAIYGSLRRRAGGNKSHDRKRNYSAVAPDCLTTFPQRTISVFSRSESWAGELDWSWNPSLASCCATAGSETICRIALPTLVTTSGGVSAGNIAPYKVVASNPGRPLSTMVGSLGVCGERSSPVVAIALSSPFVISAATDGAVANIMKTFPAMTSVSAGGPPL